MSIIYLDTNIFIYSSDKSSKYFSECVDFIRYCQKNKIKLSTSTETFQEIIHLAKNTKQLEAGLKIARRVIKLVDDIYNINKDTIQIFLEETKKYPGLESRDIIHLAVCIENKIDKIISFDRKFKSVKRVTVVTPADFYQKPD
jgi:predicted nucleic acid-binding protein